MRNLNLALAVLLLVGCRQEPEKAAEKTAEKEATPPPAVTAFALQHFIDRDEISGAVTVVVGPKGVISAEAFGLADVAHARPMRPDCMFWIASMTKPMTAMAVMMLVEEGKVRLDDPRSEEHTSELQSH